MTGRKLFNLLKNVPVFGHQNRSIRRITSGNSDVHPADFNPLRIPSKLLNNINNLTLDLAENIWIGKRALGDQLFTMKFAPRIDIYHCCIQIDGVIYELFRHEGSTYIDITSKREHPTSHESLCQQFSWTLIRQHSSCVSQVNLRSYAKLFESYKYQTLMPAGDKINCQYFVKMMLAKSIGITSKEAATIVLSIVPNLIW